MYYGCLSGGRDIVLIRHSYSGVPVTQSLEGLSTKERQKQGKAGGVVGLAYKDVPVSYLFTEEDPCIPATIQSAEIGVMEKESADHCPNVTATKETVQ
jgi:hypothetical protein